MQEEAQYICNACGEEIVIPVDITAGSKQLYVEDCPVCCNPNLITVSIDTNGVVSIDGQPVQDQF